MSYEAVGSMIMAVLAFVGVSALNALSDWLLQIFARDSSQCAATDEREWEETLAELR